jgi:hypothetical protein
MIVLVDGACAAIILIVIIIIVIIVIIVTTKGGAACWARRGADIALQIRISSLITSLFRVVSFWAGAPMSSAPNRGAHP